MVAFIFQVNQFPDLIHSGTAQVLMVAQQQVWHLGKKGYLGMESVSGGEIGTAEVNIHHLGRVSTATASLTSGPEEYLLAA